MSDFESKSVSEIAEVMPLDESQIFITRMRQPVEPGEEPTRDLLVGDVLRRTCRLGGMVCAESGCQAPRYYQNEDRDCSDRNLVSALDVILGEKILELMVGVTANNVGFFDQVADLIDEGKVSYNSQGIMELPGYNAFFARFNEEVALGARLADCGFVGVEFDDADGEKILGFMHLSRPNMEGETALKFEYDGQPVGSFEYFLRTALDHYGANLDSVKLRVAAAIKAENFDHKFVDYEAMEKRFPGWLDQGFMKNISNPNWQPSEPINPDDVWLPQYREMIDWQIKRAGIKDEQIITEDMIDPGDLELGHASNHAGANGQMPDARDLYLVSPLKHN